MSRVWGMFWLLVLTALPGAAQQPPASGGDFEIAGSVVNAVTGAPVPRAMVQLLGLAVSPVLTPPDGTFRFEHLQAREYMITAAKSGFDSVPSADQSRSSLIRVGPSRTDIKLQLTPRSVIKGVVTDARGEPVQGVLVQALRRVVEDGRAHLEKHAYFTTDDRGEYRLWHLTPGNYYVRAAGRSGGTRMYVGEYAPPVQSYEAFAPTYHGGAADLATATPFKLDPGQERRVDFSLMTGPSYRIRGAVSNFVPYQSTKVELLRGDEDVAESRVTVNATTGRFEIRDVVPGFYTVRITLGKDPKRFRGERAVQVKADLDDVVVALAPGVDIKLTCRFAGELPDGPSPHCNVDLKPVGLDAQEAASSITKAPLNEEFGISGMLQGRYRIEVSAFGAYVASVMAGDQDLLTKHELSVGTISPPPMEVVLKADGGLVVGSVESGGRSAGETWVLLMRADSSGAAENTVTDEQGRFAFEDLAPGEYFAYAVHSLTDLEYRNPQALANLQQWAARVKVTPKGVSRVTLKIAEGQ